MTGRWALGGLLIALVVAYTAPIASHGAGRSRGPLLATAGVTRASGDSRLDLLEGRIVPSSSRWPSSGRRQAP
jgi:hypothetical protein